MHDAHGKTRGTGSGVGAAGLVQAGAGRVVGGGAPWLARAARLGYAAKGLVYLTLGLVALQAAFGSRAVQGQGGALRSIAQQPAGKLLLVLIVIGMFGYAVWRLLEAARGGEGEGSDAGGLAKRALHAWSGVAYGALGVQAVRLLSGGPGGGGDGATADWTARLMALPFGRALVVAVGLGVIGYGAQQLHAAVTADVTKRLDLHGLDADARGWVVRVGRAGVGARGVVLAVVGAFLVIAAWRADPSRAIGLAGALRTVEQAPWGRWLLALTAIGLMAFGAFQVVKARYRQVAVR